MLLFSLWNDKETFGHLQVVLVLFSMNLAGRLSVFITSRDADIVFTYTLLVLSRASVNSCY